MPVVRKVASFGLILWLLLAPQVRADDYLVASADRCLLLLHGSFRSSLSLKPMQWYLDHAGYTTVNLSYPSLLYPIPESAEMAVTQSLRTCHSGGAHQINFVTHSLGGILVQLGKGDESIPLTLGPVAFELDVIAGTIPDITLLPSFPDELSDGTVSLSEARVPGVKELLTMPVTHTVMILNPEVMRHSDEGERGMHLGLVIALL